MTQIFLLSVAYFSLSIELRFLEEEDNNYDKKRCNDKKESS